MYIYRSFVIIIVLLISNYVYGNQIKNFNCNINLSTSIKNISPLEMSAPSEIKIIYDLDTNNLIDYFWDKKSIIDNSELASTNIHSKFIKIIRKGYKKTLLDEDIRNGISFKLNLKNLEAYLKKQFISYRSYKLFF